MSQFQGQHSVVGTQSTASWEEDSLAFVYRSGHPLYWSESEGWHKAVQLELTMSEEKIYVLPKLLANCKWTIRPDGTVKCAGWQYSTWYSDSILLVLLACYIHGTGVFTFLTFQVCVYFAVYQLSLSFFSTIFKIKTNKQKKNVFILSFVVT